MTSVAIKEFTGIPSLKAPLLGDFVEGQNLVAAYRLRLLDPTTAIADAIALHGGIERHGTASDSSCKQISTCIPGLGHKHCSVYLLEQAVVGICYLALSDYENGSVPGDRRIIDERPGHEQEAVTRSTPTG